MPVSISEVNSFPTDIPEQDIKQRETRQRTITLGKKGSGLEQIFSVPPYNPHTSKTSQTDLKKLIQHESPEHRAARRALEHEDHEEHIDNHDLSQALPSYPETLTQTSEVGMQGSQHQFKTALG